MRKSPIMHATVMESPLTAPKRAIAGKIKKKPGGTPGFS
jgi:hypothetical protein